MSTHTRAWRHFGIRPAAGAVAADKTDSRYCVYDSVHADYVYTQAWVDKLAADLAQPTTFEAVTGAPAVAK